MLPIHSNALFATTTPLLALLLLTIGLSISYRTIKACDIPADRLSLLTTLHAFATEGVQLLLLVVGAVNIARFHISLAGSSQFPPCTICALSLLGTVFLMALFALAVYSVDLLEGGIVLGKWKHPYAGHVLVLTRCRFGGLRQVWKGKKPQQQHRRRQIPRYRQNASPKTPESILRKRGSEQHSPLARNLKTQALEMDRKFRHLDLATHMPLHHVFHQYNKKNKNNCDPMKKDKKRHEPAKKEKRSESPRGKVAAAVVKLERIKASPQSSPKVGAGALVLWTPPPKAEKHAVIVDGSLPTPPDSMKKAPCEEAMVGEKHGVYWDKVRTEISPGGTERIGSVI